MKEVSYTLSHRWGPLPVGGEGPAYCVIGTAVSVDITLAEAPLEPEDVMLRE
jgi:hypothetical protein